VKELQKKVGPLKLWQWLAIVGGGGLTYYIYKKSHESKAEVNPEEEEKLLGALDRGTGGGGSGGAGEGSASPIGVPGVEGPKGESGISGPQGEAGITGAQGEAPSAGLEAQVNALQEDLNKNNPKTLSHNGAPQALPKGESRNGKGEIFKTVRKGNGIYHVYPGRKGASKILKVGSIHAPKKKAKRPKPTPVHKKVAAKHVAHKPKKREPVHR
jgi:hypothetical protein